jgi:hypothetical protein
LWVLVGLAFFFFVTQREVWNQTMTLLTAFAGGLAGMIQLLKLFAAQRAQKPEQG